MRLLTCPCCLYIVTVQTYIVYSTFLIYCRFVTIMWLIKLSARLDPSSSGFKLLSKRLSIKLSTLPLILAYKSTLHISFSFSSSAPVSCNWFARRKIMFSKEGFSLFRMESEESSPNRTYIKAVVPDLLPWYNMYKLGGLVSKISGFTSIYSWCQQKIAQVSKQWH